MDTEQLSKYINSIGILPILVCVACIGFAIVQYNPIGPVQGVFGAYNTYTSSVENLESARVRHAEAKAQAAQAKTKPKTGEKIIFEPTGMQLGAGASFAEPFEEMIDTAKDSGVRIKSIKYNYKPEGDPIIAEGMPKNLNACEMKITTIGTYAQLKKFFTGVLSKPYLARLVNIRVEPWGFDKSILIANFSLTLYTKTEK